MGFGRAQRAQRLQRRTTGCVREEEHRQIQHRPGVRHDTSSGGVNGQRRVHEVDLPTRKVLLERSDYRPSASRILPVQSTFLHDHTRPGHDQRESPRLASSFSSAASTSSLTSFVARV